MQNKGSVVGGLLLIAAAMVGGGVMRHTSKEASPAVIAAEPVASTENCAELCRCQAEEIAALKSKLAQWEEYGRKMEAYLGRKPAVEKPKQSAKVEYRGGNCANGQCSPYSSPRRGLFGGFR